MTLTSSSETLPWMRTGRVSFSTFQTGERRFYGNVMLRKGVVPPEEE